MASARERIEEIREKYAHYPESVGKNTAVSHIRELLKLIDVTNSAEYDRGWDDGNADGRENGW